MILTHKSAIFSASHRKLAPPSALERCPRLVADALVQLRSTELDPWFRHFSAIDALQQTILHAGATMETAYRHGQHQRCSMVDRLLDRPPESNPGAATPAVQALSLFFSDALPLGPDCDLPGLAQLAQEVLELQRGRRGTYTPVLRWLPGRHGAATSTADALTVAQQELLQQLALPPGSSSPMTRSEELKELAEAAAHRMFSPVRIRILERIPGQALYLNSLMGPRARDPEPEKLRPAWLPALRGSAKIMLLGEDELPLPWTL